MIRVCPHSDTVCKHGMNCTFSCATGEYDGTKRPTHPAPNSEREMLGSSLRDTHRAADDPWAVLEGLAKAIHLKDWRLARLGPDAKKIGPYVYAPHSGAVLSVPLSSPMSSAPLQYVEFAAAANPATVLKLIEAARASQVGMEREARNEQSPSPKPDVAGARERVADDLAAWEGSGENVTTGIADLRRILSAYDRQADEIQRQGEEIERLRGGLAEWSQRLDDLSDIHNCLSLYEISQQIARARQGGPDHG